jgi:aspartyl aminopeptidase
VSKKKHADDLLTFLDASPSPYHAVKTIAARLEEAGFTELDERQEWKLTKKSKHYVIRQDSSIVAFTIGKAPLVDSGFAIVGAHTDSPCLKLKPRPAVQTKGFLQVGVEVYGGAILATWLDRDLAIAGRVTLKKSLESKIVRTDRSLFRIPNLAIHMNRSVNEDGLKVNKQTELVPVFALDDSAKAEDALLPQLLGILGVKQAKDVADFDLCLYDMQKASFSGRDNEFIHSARLDNLASCHSGLSALIEASSKESAATRVLVCFDHEEIGSESAQGAAGPFLPQTLERIVEALADEKQAFQRTLAQSFCISSDMAHAVHPNYASLHEPNHMPKLGQGPVIKANSNQRYATSGHSAARFAQACKDAGIEPQRFVVRSDMSCGSTIGPITAAGLGITTVDVGNPMLSMHSIREMCAAADVDKMVSVLSAFWR